MRKLLAPISVFVLALVVTGCGGLSSLVPNTLAGSYQGSGTDASSQLITGTFTIGSDGTLGGTISDTSAHTTTVVSGTVSPLGILSNGSATVTITGGSSGTGSLTGTFTQTSSGTSLSNLNATLATTVGSTAYTYTFSNLQNLGQAVHK